MLHPHLHGTKSDQNVTFLYDVTVPTVLLCGIVPFFVHSPNLAQFVPALKYPTCSFSLL